MTRRELMEWLHAHDKTGYTQMISILYGQRLCPGSTRRGAAKAVEVLGSSQQVVCFSEIPLHRLRRIVERRSEYGIGFKKDVLVRKGGTPLWCVDRESAQHAAISEIIAAKVALGIDVADPFWKLTPFIDQPGDYCDKPVRFDWEREWRVVGEVRCEPKEVAFLFIPEDLHEQARQFFVDVEIEHSGPAYQCPYIDVTWPMERIKRRLSTVG